MTDETTVAKATDASPIERPDIPVSESAGVDSLGRSMAVKRGRKPLPRDAAGNIVRDGSAPVPRKAQAAPAKASGPDPLLSDANVGKAIGGVFALTSIPLGPHWKLFSPEQRELGEAIGPLARLYGPEELGKWITLAMVAPVVVNVVMPRLAIQKMILDGGVQKKQSRGLILKLKSMMAAEEKLNIEETVAEGEAWLRQMVRDAAQSAAEMKAEEMKANGVHQ